MARTALLAWEMGAGLGHVRRLMVVARAMREQGYDIVIAQRHLHTLADEVRDSGFAVVPIPPQITLAPKDQPFRAMTYADIMAITGYSRPDVLEPLLDAWDGMLRYIRPSIIVGDYCPILPMAARGRYPFLAFGDGFVVPPHEPAAFPDLRAVGEPIKPVAELTADANALLRKRGQPEAERLGQIVAGDAQVVSTFPELDIYNKHRSQPASGPLDELPPVRAVPAEGKMFIYLAADYPQTRKVLQMVADSGVPAEAFIRDAPAQLNSALTKAGIKVHTTPPPLPEKLAEASVVLHHGGMGTLETALAMGCAQLLLPRHLEQSLNARNLKQHKVAETLNADDVEASKRMITDAVNAAAWHARMHDLAQRLNARRAYSCLPKVLEMAGALVI